MLFDRRIVVKASALGSKFATNEAIAMISAVWWISSVTLVFMALRSPVAARSRPASSKYSFDHSGEMNEGPSR